MELKLVLPKPIPMNHHQNQISSKKYKNSTLLHVIDDHQYFFNYGFKKKNCIKIAFYFFSFKIFWWLTFKMFIQKCGFLYHTKIFDNHNQNRD